MNEFLAFDDADWELASAYLDNEATPVERAQVEGSPSLMGLVAELRSMQTSVAAPAPSTVDRDAMIAAALTAADTTNSRGDPVVGRVPGSVTPSPFPTPEASDRVEPTPSTPSNVTSLSAASKRRADRWKTPSLVAAALLTVMGIGFGLRSGSGGDVKTATAPAATSVAAAKAQSDETAYSTSNDAVAGAATTAAAAATTAAPASAVSIVGGAAPPTTAAAAAGTTAAPATGGTTAAPAATTAATTATTAGRTTDPTIVPVAPITPAGPPPPTLTLQELQALVVASTTGGTTSTALICPDPTGVPRLSVQILWNGQPAIAYIDQATRSLVVLAVDGCATIANIPIKDLARG
jgi:hypothetical protein